MSGNVLVRAFEIPLGQEEILLRPSETVRIETVATETEKKIAGTAIEMTTVAEGTVTRIETTMTPDAGEMTVRGMSVWQCDESGTGTVSVIGVISLVMIKHGTPRMTVVGRLEMIGRRKRLVEIGRMASRMVKTTDVVSARGRRNLRGWIRIFLLHQAWEFWVAKVPMENWTASKLGRRS